MGVTLERVQNKFACIIGELCSEPVVLSQFAIWLDLRLAEYKAKGAISLDCSGDHPDPSWLNGHRLPVKKPRDSSSARYGGSNRNSQSGEMSWSRISAERSSNQSPSYETSSPGLRDSQSPVLVKHEPDHGEMDVFPVSLHPHEITESRTPIRKRSAAEAISSEPELLPSSSKSLRLTPPTHQNPSTSTTDPTSNQSLMSIISGEIQQDESVDLTDSDISVIQSYENQQQYSSSQQSMVDNSRATTSSLDASGSGDTSLRLDDSMKSEFTPGHVSETKFSGRHGEDQHVDVDVEDFQDWCRTVKPLMYPLSFPENLSNSSIRMRIDHHNKPQHTAVDMVTAVATLERWLWKKYNETRSIETIPPEELDVYLTEFYPLLRRSNGMEYDSNSLKNIKARLDRFLKENNYPCSINRSPLFRASQEAIALKRKYVAAKRAVMEEQLKPYMNE